MGHILVRSQLTDLHAHSLAGGVCRTQIHVQRAVRIFLCTGRVAAAAADACRPSLFSSSSLYLFKEYIIYELSNGVTTSSSGSKGSFSCAPPALGVLGTPVSVPAPNCFASISSCNIILISGGRVSRSNGI